jgi:CRP-like cAMP-binding protein
MVSQNPDLQALKKSPLLSGFADAELQALEKILEYRSLKSGDILFCEGDMSNEIYFIRHGVFDICKADSTGQGSFVVAKLKKGDLVGELAFLDEAPRSALARAAEDADIIVLDKRRLIQLPDGMMLFNKLISNIALATTERLRNSTESQVKSLEQQLATVKLQHEFGQFFVYVVALSSLGMIVNNLLHTYLSFVSVYSYAFFGAYSVMLLVPSLFILWKLNIPLNAMGVTTMNWKKSLYEGGIASLVFIGLFAVLVAVVKRFELMTLKPFSLAAAVTPWYRAPVYIVHSAAQEVLGRGFLQTSFQRFFNDQTGVKSIFLASLLFGIFHIHFGLTAVVVTFLSSLVFGALYARHENIIGVSVLHYISGVCAFVTGFI